MHESPPLPPNEVREFRERGVWGVRGSSMNIAIAILAAMIAGGIARTAGAEAAPMPWNVKALSSAPMMAADPARSSEGVNAIFYEGVPWKGKPTRVFAYYGLPSA